MWKRNLQNMEKEKTGVSEKSFADACFFRTPCSTSGAAVSERSENYLISENYLMLFHREADRPQDPWRTVLSE